MVRADKGATYTLLRQFIDQLIDDFFINLLFPIRIVWIEFEVNAHYVLRDTNELGVVQENWNHARLGNPWRKHLSLECRPNLLRVVSIQNAYYKPALASEHLLEFRRPCFSQIVCFEELVKKHRDIERARASAM
jgi:hypothetical protein